MPKQIILKFLKILKKSPTFKVSPIENITKLNKGIIRKLKFDHCCGCKNAQIENKITQSGNKLVNVETKCFIKNYKILQTSENSKRGSLLSNLVSSP